MRHAPRPNLLVDNTGALYTTKFKEYDSPDIIELWIKLGNIKNELLNRLDTWWNVTGGSKGGSGTKETNQVNGVVFKFVVYLNELRLVDLIEPIYVNSVG